MAFFFLFTGLLVGASMVALSESERDYYYTNREINMAYLGNKDGLDVYRDNITGQFYVDDGWDVSRIGTAGFVPHPVDRERLRQLCTKFNPQNIPWVDFLLASFEGREQQLWSNFFEKYELGPKPKEPTWGKGIRKSRWAEYGKQIDEWEAKKADLMPRFQQECRQWDAKRKKYDEEHKEQVSRAAGQELLRRALSGGATVIQVQAPTTMTTYRATIPDGSKPGDAILVNAGGQNMTVVVPPGAYPGMEITFQRPSVQAQVVQAAPVRTAAPPAAKQPPQLAPVPPAAMPPPPAISVPPAAMAPPPAISAANPTLPRKSSMNW